MRMKAEQTKKIITTAEGNDTLGDEKDNIIRFKNYKPYDSSLTVKEAVVREDTPVAVEVSSSLTRPETDLIKIELAQYNEEELNVVPKKANWDLKSQIDEKLNRLKRKTQRAIVDILREKLAERSDDEDIDDLVIQN